MNTYLLALQLMALQGILGAFDTFYHHELTEALPQRFAARLELSIHSIRSLIYSIIFIGLSAWTWNGHWTLVLFALFAMEIVLTLWDFVIEDKTRLLPATERITHTVLAINGGAIIALLALDAPAWLSGPDVLTWKFHGGLSVFLAACGVGVGFSGLRDGIAVGFLWRREKRDRKRQPIRFSKKSEFVLVTGATGFIGRQLVFALLNDGQQVTVLTRKVKHAAWMFNGRVRCIKSMDELPDNHSIDVIINLSGAPILGRRWTARRKQILRRSRIDLTERIVQWIAKANHKPRLLLSASAIGYYGIQERGKDDKLTEDSPSQPIFMSQLCQDWETAAQGASVYGVSVKCLRFGLVLGQQGALPMLMFPIRMGLGGTLGEGNQWMSWIHIDDLIGIILHVINNTDIKGAVNGTAPNPVTNKVFSSTLARVLKRPAFLPMPAFVLKLMLGEMAQELLLSGQRVLPEKILDGDDP